jgi:thymidylate synthase ThyX
MAYSCKILKDSVSNVSDTRLTTFEVSFPRIVLAEFNTHRTFSRNSASSRAIPVSVMLARVEEDPFLPIWWGKNQKGMQAAEELGPEERERARTQWMRARDNAVDIVKRMQAPNIDLHKQIANRLLEPFLWHTVICTATDWLNFFALRCHKDAMPEIRFIADMMRESYVRNMPEKANDDYWHLPLVYGDNGLPLYPEDVNDALAMVKEAGVPEADRLKAARDILVKVSCGRCARVSYLTHDGRRDLKDDIGLYDRLRTSGHMSPLEHAARPMTSAEWVMGRYAGNFHGWVQHRKEFAGEAVFRAV